jgi:hypothetical protein
VAKVYVVPLVVELADVEGGKEVTVQMRVWNAEAGNTYEEAATNPLGVVGESNLLYTMTGNAPDPSRPGVFTLPTEMVGVQSFSVFPVPEPSACAIICCGLLIGCILKITRKQR